MGCRRGSGARGQLEVRGHIRGQRSHPGSEVTAGVEVMVGSEGLTLGSVEGFLGALWGAEGGVGPWGHLGVRGHIRGQRSQGEQSPSWPPKITILTPMDAILAPKTPHCKSLWVNGRHLGPNERHLDPKIQPLTPMDAILAPNRPHWRRSRAKRTPSWPPKMPSLHPWRPSWPHLTPSWPPKMPF